MTVYKSFESRQKVGFNANGKPAKTGTQNFYILVGYLIRSKDFLKH